MLVVVSGSEAVAHGVRRAGFDVVPPFPPTFDALVHVPDVTVAVPAPIAEIDDGEWDRRGEAVLRDALHACQAAYAAMRDRGGRIVLVTPTVGLVGGAGVAPFAMAAEGMRTLAKAAARQWGSAGITVNCVAPSLDVLGAATDPASTAAPAFGRAATMDDLIAVIASLLGDLGAAVTGTTITVDGGRVMAP